MTSLDLANRPNLSGGLSNVATVLIELFEEREVGEQALIDAARFYPSASVRRAGYLLEALAEVRLDARCRRTRTPLRTNRHPFRPAGPAVVGPTHDGTSG